MSGHKCRESGNPRQAGRCACGKALTIAAVSPILKERMPDPPGGALHMRERDPLLEASLMEAAAGAAGLPNDGGLSAYADYRAHPGGVRAEMDADQETREELADACNYLRWGIEPIFALVRAGRSEFTADYERRLRCLSHVVAAWHALHAGPH